MQALRTLEGFRGKQLQRTSDVATAVVAAGIALVVVLDLPSSSLS
jgi:hypothetical protein